jgi:regulator of protease activity HflC (stomatin/prohibitin superfamily)
MNRIIKRTFVKFIKTSETGIKQTFGKATGLFTNECILKPGMHIYIPILQTINTVSNRLWQTDFDIEVKTQDNVFAKLKVAVQWRVKESNTKAAYFSLANPTEQIRAQVENVIRANASNTSIDDLFRIQYEMATTVRSVVSDKMEVHGYTITDTLIKDIEPAKGVKDSMNEINRTVRLKIAAQNEADAYYIRAVREAAADAERKKLQGQGISDQRKAILHGYKESVGSLSTGLGLSALDILNFMKEMQRLDTYESLARSPNAKVLIIPDNSSNKSDMLPYMAANEATACKDSGTATK